MRRFERILGDGLYRSRNGIILGVCRGIADYFDFSVFWARVITLVLLFLTGFWPVMILYFVAALLMKPEPVIPIETDEEQEFYDSYVHSHRGATDRLKRRYENLERRIRRMEDHVTGREFEWENKLNS
ncbi:MAG: envelope stress response membrane protein PspC [Deltaproteobacteria bacterium]|nr:MAG: envelope stress response membrane protein PspC [Deltaproteobacteria bacterium]